MKDYIYPELWKPIGNKPEYPNECPICSSGISNDARDNYNGPVYECGGQYTSKDQIQNHTDKWWGTCPKAYMDGLAGKGLLDSDAVIWCVKENGRRHHIASFSLSTEADSYASSFSLSYPRFWDDSDGGVAYIEVSGSSFGGNKGSRYRKGECIATKGKPYHIKGADTSKFVWFKVEQKGVGTFEYGAVL